MIRILECFVKCIYKLCVVKKQYFILPLNLYHVTSKLFSCHYLLHLDTFCNSDIFFVRNFTAQFGPAVLLIHETFSGALELSGENVVVM